MVDAYSVGREGEAMMAKENVWVVGFDKITGEQVDFCCCPEGNAEFYRTLYEGKGQRVEVMTREELEGFLHRSDS